MTAYRSFAKRFVVAASLAVAVLCSASLPAPAAGVAPGTVAPLPVVAAPTAGGATNTQSPALSAVSVQAGGTQATVTFTSSEPTSAAVAVKPMAAVTTVVDPLPAGGHPPVIAGMGVVRPISNTNGDPYTPTFDISHQVTLTNLKSNTDYEATISAQTKDGRTLSQQVQFLTAKERIRITLETIDITQGDALIGDNNVNWTLGLTWGPGSHYAPPYSRGSTSTCFPSSVPYVGGICQTGSYGDGPFHPLSNQGTPLTWIFAEENFDVMPAVFTVGGSVEQEDLLTVNLIPGSTAFLPGCAPDDPDCPPSSWTAPQGVETASAIIGTKAYTNDNEFQSTVSFKAEIFYDNLSYPVPQRNQPTDPWPHS